MASGTVCGLGGALTGVAVGLAVRCMPDVDLDRFPWSEGFTIGLVEDSKVTVDYLRELATSMVAWQKEMVVIRGIETDFPAVQCILLAKRVHVRASMAICALTADDLDAGEKVQMYDEAVAEIERLRGWRCEFFSLRQRELLTGVLVDRHSYDMLDVVDRKASADGLACVRAAERFTSVAELSAGMGAAAADVAVWELPHVVIAGMGKTDLASVAATEVAADKPVVPVAVYRFLLAGGVRAVSDGGYSVDAVRDSHGVLRMGVGSTPCELDPHWSEACLLDSLGVFSDTLLAMYICGFELPRAMVSYGYCYLRCIPVGLRYDAWVKLRFSPTVGQCRRFLAKRDKIGWARKLAKVSGKRASSDPFGIYHVYTDGDIPEMLQDSDVLAGDNVSDPVVYNALRSVFQGMALASSSLVPRRHENSIMKHPSLLMKPLPILTASELDSPQGQEADADDLVRNFFSDLGVACDRVPSRSVGFSAVDTVIGVAAAEWVGQDELLKDSARARSVEERMQSGPVISDRYCKSVAKRHEVGRSRPKEGQERGRALQLDDMFVPRVVTSPTLWIKDKGTAIPGWTTYTLRVMSGEQHLVLTSPVNANCDCRLDWSGTGSSVVVANDMQCPCDGTVVWFRNALPVRVKGDRPVCLRCSVPLAGTAYALGWEIKRFALMHQSVGIKVFDKVRPPMCTDVVLKSRWKGTAGVSTFKARQVFDVTALPVGIRFVICEPGPYGESEGSPAMVGFRSSVPNAMARVGIGGVTFMPDTQGKVTVTTGDWATGFVVSVIAYTTVKFSFMFITDPHAYEVNYAGRDLGTPV